MRFSGRYYPNHLKTAMAQITSPDVELTEDGQEHLSPSSTKRRTVRALLSKLGKGLFNQEGCSAVNVTLPTVFKTRMRLAEGGLDATLCELPRPGFTTRSCASRRCFHPAPM